jgi:hypothetical protein
LLKPVAEIGVLLGHGLELGLRDAQLRPQRDELLLERRNTRGGSIRASACCRAALLCHGELGAQLGFTATCLDSRGLEVVDPFQREFESVAVVKRNVERGRFLVAALPCPECSDTVGVRLPLARTPTLARHRHQRAM